jgi:PST family polysaccharide transporter
MSLIHNAKWVSISQVGRIIIQLLSLTILTRLIPPSEYGLMAMGTVVVNLVLIVRDLGTAAAIIQSKELDGRVVNSIFWLNIIMGFSLFIIIALLSPIISHFFDAPKLTSLLILLALGFPIASAGSVHQALLERESKFKVIAVIELSAAILGLIGALLSAVKGGGAYSLALQLIINSFIASILFYAVSGWKPSFEFSVIHLRRIIGFSGNLTAFNLVNYFSRNLDTIIIGHKFDVNILGAYSLAYRIMLFPLQSLTFVASRSLYPILSRKQENIKEINAIYCKTIFAIISITSPMMLGLAILRVPFVDIVFGHNWDAVPALLLWLAPTGFIQSVLSCSGSVFMALNKTNLLLKLGLCGACLQVSAFVVGAFYDIHVFVILYLIANLLNAIPVLYSTFKLMQLQVLELIKLSLIPLFSCFCMFLFLYFNQYKLDSEKLNFAINVLCGGFTYGVSYIVASYLLLKINFVNKKLIPGILLKKI